MPANVVRLKGEGAIGGLAGWLLGRLRGSERQAPRLQLLERITLAPRQSLALVEAEGRRLLVATSADGGPAFYPLDERAAARLQGSRASREAAGGEGFMVMLALARVAAGSAPAPLLPDLNARFHPSDSTPWTILFVLTLITLLPAILMAMTPLVRLLVVFHFLRQALGTQTAPSNPTLMGLALMMTWFLMTPVLNQVDQQAVEPYRAGQITGMDAIERGTAPVKHFLLRYAREKGSGAVYRGRADSAAQYARRPAHAGGGSGLHPLRTEGRVRDRRGAVSAVSAHRHGHRLDHDLDRHVPAAAGGGLDAAEDPAVRDGGRLEPAGQLALEELLREIRMTPDMVAELLRQLMKEAMILSAPMLDCGGAAELSAEPGADADQLAGAVADQRAAPGGDGADTAGRRCRGSWSAWRCTHGCCWGTFTGTWGKRPLLATSF